MNSFEMAGFIVFVIVMVAISVWWWASSVHEFTIERRMKRHGFKLLGDPGFSPIGWRHEKTGVEFPDNFDHEGARKILAEITRAERNNG